MLGIIVYEIKKLLSWKILGLVFLISFLFYHLFLNFEFEYFPNGRPALDDYNVSKQMIDRYGHEIDDTEFKDFKQTYKKEVMRASGYLQSRSDFVNEEVTSYEDFRKMDLSSEKLKSLRNDVSFEKGIDVFWELQARESIMERFERRYESFRLKTANINKVEWKKKVLEGTTLNSIFPNLVFENYNNLITMLSILIVMSIMIIVSRIFSIDQKNNAISLQYTTKIGRKLYKSKIAASLLTSILITTGYLLLFFTMYSTNKPGPFLDSSVQSFDSFEFIWVDISFFHYIVLTVVGVYILSIISASITTYISRVFPTYITLIGTQVPIAIMLILFIKKFLISNLMSIQNPLYLPFVTYALLLAIGCLLLIIRWRKEQWVDMV